jgi:hypothetical protein
MIHFILIAYHGRATGLRWLLVLREMRVEIDCAVLDDGRRVLSQRSVNRALGRTHGGADFQRQS